MYGRGNIFRQEKKELLCAQDLQSAQGSASRDRLARRSFSVSLNSLVCASVRAISGIFGALLTSHGVVRSIPRARRGPGDDGGDLHGGACPFEPRARGDARDLAGDSFKSAPERTLTCVPPSRASPDRPPSWRASTTEAWSWAPIPARPPGRTSRTEPRIRSRRSPTTCGCADRVRYVARFSSCLVRSREETPTPRSRPDAHNTTTHPTLLPSPPRRLRTRRTCARTSRTWSRSTTCSAAGTKTRAWRT